MNGWDWLFTSASTLRSAIVCCKSFGSLRAKMFSFLSTFIAKISPLSLRRTCMTCQENAWQPSHGRTECCSHGQATAGKTMASASWEFTLPYVPRPITFSSSKSPNVTLLSPSPTLGVSAPLVSVPKPEPLDGSDDGSVAPARGCELSRIKLIQATRAASSGADIKKILLDIGVMRKQKGRVSVSRPSASTWQFSKLMQPFNSESCGALLMLKLASSVELL
mmetsp:Transcript_73780/g.221803  ORF Transcript_73780/g.221803 Transcript_73780/m.221803 type:complete len:221 (+) Transcript_73780:264-926(+)